jgi:AsmA family protein
MERYLAGAGALLAALLSVLIGLLAAGLLVLILFFDWNDAKPLVSRLVSTALGREFVIEGDLDADLGWVTSVHAEGITLANAPWGQDPNMVEIAALDASIDVRELLSGRIVLLSLVVREPRILLETNENGEANWAFYGQPDEEEEPAAEERSELPVIEEMVIEDGLLVYRDRASGADVELAVAKLTAGEDVEQQVVRIEGNGTYQGRRFTLDMTGGSLKALRNGNEPYPVDLALVAGDFKAKAKGTLTDPANLKGIDLALDVRGEDMANLFPILGLVIPPTPPYRLSGQLEHQGTEWTFADFAGQLGGSDLRGTLAVATGGQRPLMKADLASNKLDFADLAGFIGAEGGGSKGVQEGASESADRGRVLPDTEIDLSRLHAMDAEVTFAGRRIVTPDLPIDRFAADLSLQGGTLRLQPVSFGIGDGSVHLFLSLYGSQEPVEVDMEGRVQQIDLKQLLRGSQFAEESAGLFSGEAKISATGASVADILGSASGDVTLMMAEGSISHLVIEAAGLDVAEALGLMIEGDKPIPIRCIVADFAAQQGLFTSRTLVFDTTDSNIVGEGTIDMGGERLDLRVEAHPKDFSPFALRAPISIQGAFNEPSIFPDPTGIGVETTLQKVLNAVVTVVKGLLPPMDPGGGGNAPCEALISQAQEATGEEGVR